MFRLLISLIVLMAFASPGASSFVIEPERPYVYLSFDHRGSRTPMVQGESSEGLWLRLVNNCSLPITVLAHDTESREQGPAVDFEVVPAGNTFLRSSGAGGPASPISAAKIPRGYSFDVASEVVIEPGESLLFSVPAESIAPSWYVRVSVKLQVGAAPGVEEPYTVVTFDWSRLMNSSPQH